MKQVFGTTQISFPAKGVNVHSGILCLSEVHKLQ